MYKGKKRKEKGRRIATQLRNSTTMARVNHNIHSTAVIPTTSNLHPLVSCPTLPACPVPEEVLCMLHRLHRWQCSHLTSGTEVEDVLTTFMYMKFSIYLQYSLKEIAFYYLCLVFLSKLVLNSGLGRQRKSAALCSF